MKTYQHIIIGSLIAFAIVGVVLYFLWPTILQRTIAGLKGEATAQNLVSGILDSFKTISF